MAKKNIGRGKGQKKRIYGKHRMFAGMLVGGQFQLVEEKERNLKKENSVNVIYKESYLKFYKGHCN